MLEIAHCFREGDRPEVNMGKECNVSVSGNRNAKQWFVLKGAGNSDSLFRANCTGGESGDCKWEDIWCA